MPKIEIEMAWADVDALQNGVDLVRERDIFAAILAAQGKQPVPQAHNVLGGRIRSLAERIIGQLPPREEKT